MRKITGFLLAGLVALSTSGGATAQDQGTAVVNVSSSGVLAASIDDATFTSVGYSFVDQTTSASVVVKAEDNTGSGSGWNVTLYGSPFSRDETTSFPVSNLVLADGTVTSTSGQDTTGVTAPGLTMGSTSPGPKVAIAPLLSGMGHYTITYAGTLTVPGGTLVGRYESTLTISITSGP